MERVESMNTERLAYMKPAIETIEMEHRLAILDISCGGILNCADNAQPPQKLDFEDGGGEGGDEW